MGPLPPNRQTFTVSQPTVRAHINVTFDIHRCIPPKIPLDLITLIDELADLYYLIIGKVIALGIEINPGRLEDPPRTIPANPEDIG